MAFNYSANQVSFKYQKLHFHSENKENLHLKIPLSIRILRCCRKN